jgi:methylated-DNA-[protein]-cysteine S-methyltransferase
LYADARLAGETKSREPALTANGVVPCHRVIGAHGHLTGYGGGLPLKRALLEHEAAHRPASARAGALF